MLFVSCADNEKDSNSIKETISYTEYLLDGSGSEWKWVSQPLDSRQNLILINKKEALSNCLINNHIAPSVDIIDFETNSLLVAYGQASNGIDHIEILFHKKKQYELKLNITTNEAEEAPVWTVSIIVPKIHIEDVELAVLYSK